VLLASIAACSSSPGTSGGGASATTSSGSETTASGRSSSGASSATTTTTTSTGSGTGTTSSGGGAGYSCEVKSALLHVCTLYGNLPPGDVAAQMAMCASLKGTSGASSPMGDALGACTSNAAGVVATETWYTDGATTAAMAQAACDNPLGTWTPG
jgi:hypothetical protein